MRMKVDGFGDSDKNGDENRKVVERMMRLILMRVLQSPDRGPGDFARSRSC